MSLNQFQASSVPRASGIWALLASAAIVGCSSPVKLDDKAAPVESRTGTSPGAANASSNANANANKVTPVDLTKTEAMAASNLARIVYFDFDSYVIKDEFRPVVDAHARVLSADRKKRMSLEGHTDERGGREYNLALGQKRSESVLKALTLLGANDAQLEAVSFGKERPAMQGSDEAAWAKNRRVELGSR